MGYAERSNPASFRNRQGPENRMSRAIAHAAQEIRVEKRREQNKAEKEYLRGRIIDKGGKRK